MRDNFIQREIKFLKKYKYPPYGTQIDVDVFEKVVQGQLIFIFDSTIREYFETKFIKWKSMFSVSNKYWNVWSFHVVPKNTKLAKPLIRMLVNHDYLF